MLLNCLVLAWHTFTCLICFYSYQADEELGNLEIMDTVYLNVSDNNGNMAAMQPFIVSIVATDNHPPIVTIHSNLEVCIIYSIMVILFASLYRLLITSAHVVFIKINITSVC